jgi:hypothetical protein
MTSEVGGLTLVGLGVEGEGVATVGEGEGVATVGEGEGVATVGEKEGDLHQQQCVVHATKP